MSRHTPTATALLAALAAATLTACQVSAPNERPNIDHPLNGVTSVCDQFGHRVYRYDGGYKTGGIDVIPNDATCIKATIR